MVVRAFLSCGNDSYTMLNARGLRIHEKMRCRNFPSSSPKTRMSPPVDSLRVALVPLAKGVRLSVIEARGGAVSCRGEMGRVLAEALGGSLVRGREGHSGLPHHKNRPEGGLQKANRILHHVQWQRPCK